MDSARSRGLNVPLPREIDPKGLRGHSLQINPNAVDTFRALVILVDFSDNRASGGSVYGKTADFHDLVFSRLEYDTNYSMSEFYDENSYGSFHLEGTVVGWYRMPETYAYYVDGQKGFGYYPQNAQKLAEDAILAADPDVNFADYDNDNDGWLDGVFIVHAGEGYETSGSYYQIHSHMWVLYEDLLLDGVNISAYTMEPEEANGELTTMGVFAHEYGHFIGLPDLYDIDQSSEGVGDWSLMSGGSWNDGGRHPAFMDAWCKKEVNFLSFINVTSNMTDVEIPASIYNPVAYRLWQNGETGPQYFLIENRQKTGNDAWIDGSGLLILHVDEMVWDNSNEEHFLVAVEQADGQFQLENNENDGDAGDVWSTYTKTSFDDLSTPKTRDYNDDKTKTAVWNISAPGSVMTANFDITYSRPYYELQNGIFSDADYGNDNGVFEPGESVTFTFTVQNLWLDAYNVAGTMTSDNNDFVFDVAEVNIGNVSGEGGTGNNLSDPIIFTVPADFNPCIDSFFLEVSSDNFYDARTFGYQLNVGGVDVLVIDDDDGEDYEEAVTSLLYDRRIPFDVWDKQTGGSPSGSDLNEYGTVMWLIGEPKADILSGDDVTALSSFLDNGGNLLMAGQTFMGQLDTTDQDFLHNYLRVAFDSTYLYPFMLGVDNSPIGDGIKIRYSSNISQPGAQVIHPVNGSELNFELKNGGGGTAVSYNGSYKLVLFSFGFYAIGDRYVIDGYTLPDTVFQRIVNFFYPSSESINPIITSSGMTDEVITNVVNHTPAFEWTVTDTTAYSVIEYQVMVGTGDQCNNSDNMWDPGILSGDEIFIVYDGEALEDGQDYVFQVQVNNGESWSTRKSLAFHMNEAPRVGFVAGPKDELVNTLTPILNQTIGVDLEEDEMTYCFELYSDAALTSLVTSVEGWPQGDPNPKWTVDVTLVEDQQYFWRGRCFDGYEYSEYTEVASFVVNAGNNAPGAFDLISPTDGETIKEIYPTFFWGKSIDIDPEDFILYTLWTSTDPGFETYTETSYLVDTSRTLSYPLEENMSYYWKVKAVDQAMAETWSSQVFLFDIAGGCCIGIRGNANGDEEESINIIDIVYLVSYCFDSGGGLVLECPPEANANGDIVGSINISDITYLVAYCFGGGPAPPPCP